MIYLGIDLGGKRTGLAVGNDLMRQAGPVDVIHESDPQRIIQAIRDAVEQYAPDALVVGLPLHMDDTAGPEAKAARGMAEQLQQATGLPVHMVDERLTTYEADDRLKQSGYTHKQKKNRRDAIAAAVLLQQFLDDLP